MSADAPLDAESERACPACGSRSFRPFACEYIDRKKIDSFSYASRKQPEFMRLRLVLCATCDLVYAPTPTSADFLSGAYSQAAFDSGVEAQAAARSYAKALTPYLSRLAARNAAVDVGAGSGPLLPWLKNAGFSPVVGIEPSRSAIDAAPPDVRPMLREGMFSAALVADLETSLLCSFMTLEHLADPAEFARTANRLLEPGGMLAVVVHNWRAPLNRLLGLRSPIIDIEHMQLFSPRSIRTLLIRAGFEKIEQIEISNSYPLRYWLRLTPLPVGLKQRITDTLDRYGHLADRHFPMRVGNMLAIGIKPAENQHDPITR